jgi:hypothetical protein
MKTNFIFLFIALVIIAALIGTVGYFILRPTAPAQVACTQEAKICPDGSTVGRVGPNCEFASCPPIATGGNLKTFSDSKTGISFQYPDNLGTTFISPVDWPPAATVSDQPYSCTQAGSETAPAGQTVEKTFNGRAYCVTKESQGAAGSIYTQYAYAYAMDSKTAILTFSLRFVQCANYDDPQMTACKNEQASFDIDNLADSIAASLRVTAN